MCCRGVRAAFEMVKVYLHPEIEAMWADSGSAGPRTPNADAAAAAQKLLADVRVTEGTAAQHQVRSWVWVHQSSSQHSGRCCHRALPTPAAMHSPLPSSDVHL